MVLSRSCPSCESLLHLLLIDGRRAILLFEITDYVRATIWNLFTSSRMNEPTNGGRIRCNETGEASRPINFGLCNFCYRKKPTEGSVGRFGATEQGRKVQLS